MSKEVIEVELVKAEDTPLCNRYTFGGLGDAISGAIYVGKNVIPPRFVIFRMPGNHTPKEGGDGK